MFGADEASIYSYGSTAQASGCYHHLNDGKGIVPRACEEIFHAVQQRREVNGIEAEVFVSYVEVFGDEVSDLLKRGARCGQSKVASQRFVISGAAERVITNMQDVADVLKTGELCVLLFQLFPLVYVQSVKEVD